MKSKTKIFKNNKNLIILTSSRVKNWLNLNLTLIVIQQIQKQNFYMNEISHYSILESGCLHIAKSFVCVCVYNKQMYLFSLFCTKTNWLLVWLISMVCQPVWGYFMPQGLGIVCITFIFFCSF